MQSRSESSLFVWRCEYSESFGSPGLRRSLCQWCTSALQTTDIGHLVYPWTDDYEQHCSFCGWSLRRLNWVDEDRYPSGDVQCWCKELDEFRINSKEAILSDVGRYLTKRFSDIYALTPRRFEELIADVFRNYGYQTVLTPPTRDDGVDVYVLGDSGNTLAIVEVKRFAEGRKVGVGVVDRLRGVQLRKGVNHAVLVTTGSFTSAALASASAPAPLDVGFSLDLIDAEGLLRLLGVYGSELPSLKDIVHSWDLSGRSRRPNKTA